MQTKSTIKLKTLDKNYKKLQNIKIKTLDNKEFERNFVKKY